MKKGLEKKVFSKGKYLKSGVYGGLDGIITTFAIVAGVVGAGLSSSVILILGFANLIADGISMAVGDYLSTKSQGEYYKKDAKKVLALIAKNKKYKKGIMLNDELELVFDKARPEKNALVTFSSFLTFGFVPLLIFVVGAFLNSYISHSFLIASILSGISLFVLGIMKSKVTNKHWFKSGFETLLVGGVAAVAAYFVGELLSKLV
ncbi:MAG: VIT1/CCC1 transporter family protein [Nanoarchaeota archaeon]|nr:VIT1/CCC1 transporter family protein [Nanoarchaeota archaeon]